MISAAERSGQVFSIMFNQRKNPLFRLARGNVKSGARGAAPCWIITMVPDATTATRSWRATWRGEGGGAQQAPHNQPLQWIFGMP